MHSLGIKTGKDLKALPLETLQHYFGKAGLHYYSISRGIDNRPVNNCRIRKSVGVEITFQQDIKAKQDVITQLQSLLDKALSKIAEKQLVARTLTVKIKYHDFVQITRSRTLPQIIGAASSIGVIVEDLVKNTDIGRRNVRLLGVTLSSLENKSEQTRFQQMDLFGDCMMGD
jgi:DNA polymerase-4